MLLARFIEDCEKWQNKSNKLLPIDTVALHKWIKPLLASVFVIVRL